MGYFNEQTKAYEQREELRRGDWAVPVVHGPPEFVWCRHDIDERSSHQIRHRFDDACEICAPSHDDCDRHPCEECHSKSIDAAEAMADAREDR